MNTHAIVTDIHQSMLKPRKAMSRSAISTTSEFSVLRSHLVYPANLRLHHQGSSMDAMS